MKTFSNKDEMPPQMIAVVTQMMESQAYRELAAAHTVANSVDTFRNFAMSSSLPVIFSALYDH